MKFNWKYALLAALITCGTARWNAVAQTRIDLAGEWHVRLDPNNAFDPETDGTKVNGFQPVQLPGTLRDSGLGAPVGPDTRWIGNSRPDLLERPEYKKYQAADHFKMPFWLQPERHYVGSAYYRRFVDIPESWRGQRVLLTLERPHWQTWVWVDGKPAGHNDSLSTPHVFDVTPYLVPGRRQLTIRVNNSLDSLDVGVNSHSVSDHTQTAWHGIVGRIELRLDHPVAIGDVQVLPAENARSVKVMFQVTGAAGRNVAQKATLRVSQRGQVLGERTVPVKATGGEIECMIPFQREADRWDEFAPNLCQLDVTLSSDSDGLAPRRVTFGIRHIGTRGTQFVLNDRPLFLRGTLECCIFPLTGYPPTDVASWKRIIRICKKHGLNHIRFHSWCPPEAAFAAADELGFYYQVECSTWPNQSTSLGDGKPVDEWLYREGERILAAYGNHPSFLLLSMGNEPGGRQHAKYLKAWVEHFKAKTDRQLVTAGSGWPSIPENEYHVTPRPRIQQWGQGLRSRINAQAPATIADYRDFVGRYDVPVVSHEIGQWCVYPNFDEMKKYTGALKPRNFEIFRELLDNAHMLDQARDFLMASGKLQTLCYKEEIESALRTPGFGGFQLLDLHDFPGQGTALVGVLDPFWDSKPYITPDEFSRFCSPTVPLARMTKRSWTSDETFAADVEIAHFGPVDLSHVAAQWNIRHDAEVLASGVLPAIDVPTGKLTSLGQVAWPLGSLKEPVQLNLQVRIEETHRTHANDWNFWVYPRNVSVESPKNIRLVHALDDQTAAHLKQGGTVVLMADPNRVKTDVQIGFSSIFWNTAWTSGQAPHTLGLLCNSSHPVFQSFPTGCYSDWQWWSIVSRSKPMVLDALPPELRPLVQVIPDWFRPQRLALVFEARVGNGRLLVSSIDLDHDLDQRPAARQLRHSLLQYAASASFQPHVEVDLAALDRLFREPTVLQRIGARIEVDSEHRDHPGVNAVDGNVKTIWHTDWEPKPALMPHTLTIDLGKPFPIKGMLYVPRQDMTNGRIAEYSISISQDGKDWSEPVASGTLSDDAATKFLHFKTHTTRFVRLTITREVKGRPFASVAELDVVPAESD